MFRLLPVHPGPDVSAAAVAALAGIPFTEARGALRSLDRACLVQAAPGSGARWQLRDFVRAYARRLSRRTPRLTSARWLGTGCFAITRPRRRPADGRLRGRPPIPVPQEFDDRDEALAWLDIERPNLLAVTRMAADAAETMRRRACRC